MPDFLKKLNPRQRQLAIAAGLGGLLALFVILRRRGTPAANTDPASTTVQPAADPSTPIADASGYPAGSSTFADNGAALGQLDTTLTGITGQLQTVIDNQTAAANPTSPTDAAPATTVPPVVVNVNTVGGAKAGKGVGGKAAPKVVYDHGVRYTVGPKGKRTVAPTKAHPATKAKTTHKKK